MKGFETQNAEAQEELLDLADAVCNERLTWAERKRLERLLADDEAAQLAYLTFLDIHAQMSWWGRAPENASMDDLMDVLTRGTSVAVQQKPSFLRRLAAGHRVGWWLAAAGVAAALLVVCGYFTGRGGTGPTPPPEEVAQAPPVAACVREFNAQWQTDQDMPLVPTSGEELPPGRYGLVQGAAEIRLDEGVAVTLEGPALIELIDSRTAYLHEGRISANMQRGASRVIVRTPTATIVDRGTEFGVAVDQAGDTRVQVYEGWVEVALDDRMLGNPSTMRRVWPLTTMEIRGEEAGEPATLDFEPLRFLRQCPTASPETGVSTSPSIQLDPQASTRVREFVEWVASAPATDLRVGSMYRGCVPINSMSQPELDTLVPALIAVLDDHRFLPLPEGQKESLARPRVSDRAELALEFVAGIRPEREDRSAAWEQWWSTAKGSSRRAWLVEHRSLFRQILFRWQTGGSYRDSLDAVKALEIAGRARDRVVLPILRERLRHELAEADRTEVSLAAILQCIGELGDAGLVPEMVRLARRLNAEQKASVPTDYSAAHARRGSALRAFAATLDKLAAASRQEDAVQPIGPVTFRMCALDEAYFDLWLADAKQRGGRPGAARQPATPLPEDI